MPFWDRLLAGAKKRDDLEMWARKLVTRVHCVSPRKPYQSSGEIEGWPELEEALHWKSKLDLAESMAQLSVQGVPREEWPQALLPSTESSDPSDAGATPLAPGKLRFA